MLTLSKLGLCFLTIIHLLSWPLVFELKDIIISWSFYWSQLRVELRISWIKSQSQEEKVRPFLWSLHRSQGKSRLHFKWTQQMNSDVLECKRKAQEIIACKSAPCNNNGRKKGYIEVVKKLWDEMGYGHIGLKGQNLQDQALRLEKNQLKRI